MSADAWQVDKSGKLSAAFKSVCKSEFPACQALAGYIWLEYVPQDKNHTNSMISSSNPECPEILPSSSKSLTPGSRWWLQGSTELPPCSNSWRAYTYDVTKQWGCSNSDSFKGFQTSYVHFSLAKWFQLTANQFQHSAKEIQALSATWDQSLSPPPSSRLSSSESSFRWSLPMLAADVIVTININFR